MNLSNLGGSNPFGAGLTDFSFNADPPGGSNNQNAEMVNASGGSVVEEEAKTPADALNEWAENVSGGHCEYTVDQIFT